MGSVGAGKGAAVAKRVASAVKAAKAMTVSVAAAAPRAVMGAANTSPRGDRL